MDTTQLAKAIFQVATIDNSYYITSQDGKRVVRIGNHLPRVANFQAYNEDATEIMLIFTEDTADRDVNAACDFCSDFSIEFEKAGIEIVSVRQMYEGADLEDIKAEATKFVNR